MSALELMPVSAFDELPASEAAEVLRPSCASTRWIDELVAARPYRELSALLAASTAALARLDWPDLQQALDAHPRIGDRATGADRESSWSRAEQSGAAEVPSDVRTQLRNGNLAYEQRFGYVFLIRAAGRSADEMLAALRTRLGNDDDIEHEVVRTELTQIVELRLAKTFR